MADGRIKYRDRICDEPEEGGFVGGSEGDGSLEQVVVSGLVLLLAELHSHLLELLATLTPLFKIVVVFPSWYCLKYFF